VYAQYNNRKSGTKTVSQFDDRTQVYISLKINAKAKPSKSGLLARSREIPHSTRKRPPLAMALTLTAPV
jgi:hypothetical protein